MYAFRHRQTGAYPVTPNALREAHKAQASFGPTIDPDVADALGYDLVLIDAEPAFEPLTHALEALPPVIVGGAWVQGWTVQAIPAAVLASRQAQAGVALQAAVVAATQTRLDAFAKTRNYDSILSACTYASSAVPKFAGEGQAAVNARDHTWAALYTVLAQVQAGQLPMPGSFADIEPLLPVLVWPA